MSIFNNLKKVRAAIARDTVGNDISPLSTALNTAALQALAAGFGQDEWGNYMAVFAENQAQLDRLTIQTPGEETYLQQMRAYILTNGICDMGTNGDLPRNVNIKIDGIVGSINNPPVPDAPNDPGGTIANRRPAELKDVLE
jgi:hypothetical protein